MKPAVQVSSMPLPPLAYIERYSNESIGENKAPKPPPVQNTYEAFGDILSESAELIKPLEAYDVPRLYSGRCERKRVLKKLNVSLLASFLDLLDIMVKCPESADGLQTASHEQHCELEPSAMLRTTEKINDITVLSLNMYHLINEMKVHQARETLRCMMIAQWKKRKYAIALTLNSIRQTTKLATEACDKVPDVADSSANLPIDTKKDAMETSELTSCSISVVEDLWVHPTDRILCQIVDETLLFSL